MGFWYENLNASLKELESLLADLDPLSASNQLLKLRETIMDNGEKGTRVTVPPNIQVFPNQFVYRVARSMCGLGIAGGLIAIAGMECDPKATNI